MKVRIGGGESPEFYFITKGTTPLSIKYKNASPNDCKEEHKINRRLQGFNAFLPFFHSHSFPIFSTTCIHIHYPFSSLQLPFWRPVPNSELPPRKVIPWGTSTDRTSSSLNLCLARLEIEQGDCIFNDGEGLFSFIITLKAAVLHAGSDAMATLLLLQRGEIDGANSWVPALMRHLKNWLLSTYTGRKEIHSEACKRLDNDTHIFCCDLCWLLGFSDYSFSRATQLKVPRASTLLLLDTRRLLKGTAVVQIQLGAWKTNRERVYFRSKHTSGGTLHSANIIVAGWGTMLFLFPAGNTAWHPADGTRGEVFPGWPRTEPLSGGEGMGQEFETPPERGEVGRDQRGLQPPARLVALPMDFNQP